MSKHSGRTVVGLLAVMLLVVAPGATADVVTDANAKAADDFTKEVAVARIYDGVHYRNSTVVGTAMGKKIGELAAQAIPRVTR